MEYKTTTLILFCLLDLVFHNCRRGPSFEVVQFLEELRVASVGHQKLIIFLSVPGHFYKLQLWGPYLLQIE